MHVVVVMCVLCGCEVITDMTKLCVHVFTTSSDAENYCHQVETTWCEAVTKMQLVIVCTPCEGKATVEWTYNEVTLNETSAQLTFPPDKVVMSASGCYRCSCQGSNSDAAFDVEMRSAGVYYVVLYLETPSRDGSMGVGRVCGAKLMLQAYT